MRRVWIVLVAAGMGGLWLWRPVAGQEPTGARTRPAGSATACSATTSEPAISLQRAQELYAAGLRLQNQGKLDEAIELYKLATREGSRCAPAINHFAWLRATNPDVKYRNGAEAVRLSERASKLTADEDPDMDVANILDTLAAAYAEAGRFQDAVAAAKKSGAMAESLGNRGAAAEFQARQKLYEAGKAYHEGDPLDVDRPPPRPRSRPSRSASRPMTQPA